MAKRKRMTYNNETHKTGNNHGERARIVGRGECRPVPAEGEPTTKPNGPRQIRPNVAVRT